MTIASGKIFKRASLFGLAQALLVTAAAAAPPAPALAPPAPAPEPPPVVSPEVQADGRVVFRIKAPDAKAVRISSGDMAGLDKETGKLAKGKEGVWETTVGPLPPGSYRYNFNLDGVAVIDPRNPASSESNNNVWSLVHVPGAAFMDVGKVPHGAVAQITYFSTALDRFRRMTVYTPPGYEKGGGKFPVFYLLHGSSDSDNSWTSIGRAAVILDNLIAAKQARPMIVVMPHGHTSSIRTPSNNEDFVREFLADILPTVEKNYRVLTDRRNRAIAGLSMGGGQTLHIAIPHLDKFAYVGVFSSSMPGLPRVARPGQPAPPPPPPGPPWEEQNKAALENPALKKGLALFWIGTGKDDFGAENTKKSVDIFTRYGFSPVFKLSEGGHTWANWRDYLNEFAPQLFVGKAAGKK